MTKLLLPALAVLVLAGCEPETITQEPNDPMKEELANAAPVTLPPAVTASKSFRCKDNSIVYVDFFDGSFVNFKAEKDAPPTRLEATTPGSAWGAGETKVSGDPTTVTVTQPGKAEQSCKA